MPHATGFSLKITPFQPSKDSKINVRNQHLPQTNDLTYRKQFGADIEGVDLNEVSEEDFQKIKAAVYEHQLVIIRKQQALKPQNHFDFVHRFDPEAPAIHGHGTAATVTKKHKGQATLLAQVSVRHSI
jgi:alpha-ketoglutarate-dependent taurine dioxygenase